MDKLLDKTKGCSGADIEGIVRESIEAAFADVDRSVPQAFSRILS